ncbi:Hint domain-containing protein [Acetobacter oryzifermentans]
MNSGGTVFTTPGAILSGSISVVSGGILSHWDKTESGGSLASGASITVSAGGIVNGITVLSNSYIADGVDGQVANTIVSSGGNLSVAGTASNTTVDSGGVIKVTSGGTATDSTINGGSAGISANGVLNTATVGSNGIITVSSGGSANAVTVNTSGALVVSKGGILSATVVSSGGELAVAGTASNTTVDSGGVIEITSGGTATGTTVNSGGLVYADSNSILDTTTVSNGGQVSAASGATISGTLTLENGGSATIWNNAGGSVDLQGGSNTGLVISGLASGGTLNTVINGFDGASASNSDSIELAGVKAADVSNVSYPTANQVQLTLNNGNTITLNIVGVGNYGFTLTDGADGWLSYEVCFLSGSMIRTPEGDVAVENLQIGDRVVALDWKNNKEASHRVAWVGKAHATVRPELSDDEAGYPVRILKDAIAQGVPYKDMLITPEHCLFFEGKFVPARMLVNGVSIFYDKSITSYDYYHVETEQHSVITADGMLTESYLDTGNRSSFRQEGKIATLRNAARNWDNDAGAPLCVERSFVEPLFHKLLSRVTTGVSTSHQNTALTNDPDLHLVTESGAIIRPIRHDGERYSFMLPANMACVRIVSRASRPADVIGPFVDDRRMMGVAVADVYFVTAKQQTHITAHLQSEKPVGWHATDWTDCAWTNGDAVLPLDELAQSGMGILSLNIRAAGPYLEQNTKAVLENRRSA